MNPEGIMLSKISQTEKDKYCMISLICGILKKKKTELVKAENRMVVTKGWGKEKSEMSFKSTNLQPVDK